VKARDHTQSHQYRYLGVLSYYNFYLLHSGWPSRQIIKHLVDIAEGLFIWAATACRFIREGKNIC
jgi:hypothetical protein